MEIIDRYIYAVVKQLPESTRLDVEKELRSNIADMLPESYTEADARQVLTQLGNPAKLAEEYQGVKRYLIGPKLYDSYLSTLKLIEAILVSIVFVASLIGILVNPEQGTTLVTTLVNGIVKVFDAVFDTAVQTFLWVTISFAIVERCNAGEQYLSSNDTAWSIDKLEPIPQSNSKRVPKGEAVFEIIWCSIFGVVLWLVPNVISWYEFEQGQLLQHVPLFNTPVLRSYLPMILTIAWLGIFKAVLKLVYGMWNRTLVALSTLNNLLFIALTTMMVSNPSLVNSSFKAQAASRFQVDLANFERIWSLSLRNLAVVVVIVCLVEIVTDLWKLRQVGRAL